MLKRYITAMLCAALLLIVLTTSGCYTVIKMRTSTIFHPELYGEVEYDYGYDPFYYYHPYQYYSYSSWYYTPWTYWCCDPYWTYPSYWRTYSSCTDAYTYETVKWHKSQNRRGLQTRKSFPTYTPDLHGTHVRRSAGEGQKSLKKIRKVGMGPASQSTRRSGISKSSPSTGSTITRPAPSVSRSSSSISRSSSKSTSTKQSSAPARRRGSKN